MTEKTTRQSIVASADDLFYRQGFEATSFADIASAVGISRGNFYHHFKSKDEILDAVIAARMANTQGLLEHWEARGDTPLDRLRAFVDLLVVNQAKIMRYGCPVGTLCAELFKLDHAAQQSAANIFTLFRVWLGRQFTLLGRKDDADELALHVLARSQGVATLAQAYGDRKFVAREVEKLHQWLEAFAQKE